MSEETQPCSNFQIDLTGAFGICKNCHLPKIKHAIESDSQPKANSANFQDKLKLFSQKNAQSKRKIKNINI